MKISTCLYSVCVALLASVANVCAQNEAVGQSYVQHMVAQPTASGSHSASMRAAMNRVGLPSYTSDDIVLNRSFYSTAFSKTHCEAKWVMWALTPDMLGAKGSRYPFVADSDLKNYDYRVEKSDYDGSGYSRGHMMPAADCKFSTVASMECALMSNICPQTMKMNSGCWNSLESRCREWAHTEDTIYIVCGPVYYHKTPKKIGREHRLDVPDAFFKIVLSMRKGHEKMIGFVMGNTENPEKMQNTLCTVADIEAETGIVFFPNLNPKFKARLDNESALSQWKTPKQQNRNYNSKDYDNQNDVTPKRTYLENSCPYPREEDKQNNYQRNSTKFYQQPHKQTGKKKKSKKKK